MFVKISHAISSYFPDVEVQAEFAAQILSVLLAPMSGLAARLHLHNTPRVALVAEWYAVVPQVPLLKQSELLMRPYSMFAFVVPSPVGRHLEGASPNATMSSVRMLFVPDVLLGVLPACQVH